MRRAGDCRHKTYPRPGLLNLAATCKAGVVVAETRLSTPGPIWDRDPCDASGRTRGAACVKCDPWTPEEVAEYEREMERIMDEAVTSLRTGKCATCGKALIRRGTAFACPDGHVSGFACGRRDIDETGGLRRRGSP